jgi:hypothetical protein
MPQGIYDRGQNTGYLNRGTSKDTRALACDSLRKGWYPQGRFAYPQATALLVWCDGGGSNDARQSLFQSDLQRVANAIGLEIRMAREP